MGIYDATYGSWSDDLEDIVSGGRNLILRHVIDAFLSKKTDKPFNDLILQAQNIVTKKIQHHLDEIDEDEEKNVLDTLVGRLEYEFDIDTEGPFQRWIDQSNLLVAEYGIDARDCVEYIVYSEKPPKELSQDFLKFLETERGANDA